MIKLSDLVKTSTAISEAAATSQFAMHALNVNANGELVYTKVLFANTSETIDMTTGDGFAYNGVEEFISGVNKEGTIFNEMSNLDGYPFSVDQPEERVLTVKTIVNGANVQFTIDGVVQPNIVMYKGAKYIFDTSDSSTANHPIYISTAPAGNNYATEYTKGVTNSRSANNGGYGLPISNTSTTSEFMIFEVPADAPTNLYYASGNSASTFGYINVREAQTDAKYRKYNQVRFDNQQLNYYINANGYLVARYGADYNYS